MIVLDDLTKSFGEKRVLRGVSLDVPDGQNTVMIGASGSGKSVTLKLIVGLIEPQGRSRWTARWCTSWIAAGSRSSGAGWATSSSSPRSSTP